MGKEYIEDYNTATMPSKKYYNLNVWDSQRTAKLAKKKGAEAMNDAQKEALASFDDERARMLEMKHAQAKKQEQQVTDEVRRLRADKGKVDKMKTEASVRAQIDMLNKSGNFEQAEKLQAKMSKKDNDREYAPR